MTLALAVLQGRDSGGKGQEREKCCRGSKKRNGNSHQGRFQQGKSLVLGERGLEKARVVVRASAKWSGLFQSEIRA